MLSYAVNSSCKIASDSINDILEPVCLRMESFKVSIKKPLSNVFLASGIRFVVDIFCLYIILANRLCSVSSLAWCTGHNATKLLGSLLDLLWSLWATCRNNVNTLRPVLIAHCSIKSSHSMYLLVVSLYTRALCLIPQ